MKKVQFCCGQFKLEGFDNWDLEVDITKPLPYENDSVDFIFIEHGLEHISAINGLAFLEESHRILKAGGIIRICVPHLKNVLNREQCRDLINGYGHQMLYSKESLTDILYAAGFNRSNMQWTGITEIDSHWKSIGLEWDELQSIRIEVTK